MTNKQLVLENLQAPGDGLMFTCAVRDLHKQYPQTFITSVSSSTPDIWTNNPYNKNVDRLLGSEHIRVGYSSAIHQSNFRSAHFSTGFCQELSEKLGTRVRLTDMRPDLHFTDQELDPKQQKIKEPYWVAIAGGKSDFTAKVWDHANWQTLVTDLRKDTQIVQAGGRTHNHKPLTGVIDIIGKTSFREFMLLIKHSQGVICPVTCAMHLAAACNKPCVVIAGGREGFWWEAYTKKTWEASIPNRPYPSDFVEHAFLHTIDKLPCCTRGGCWKNGIGEQAHHKNCTNLVRGSAGPAPKCLQLITPSYVAEHVRNYMAGKPVVVDDIPQYLRPGLFTEPLPANRQPIYIAPPTAKPRDAALTIRRMRSGKLRRHLLPTTPRSVTGGISPVNLPRVRVTGNRLPLKPISVPTNISVRTNKPWTGPFENMKSLTICALTYGDYPELIKRCTDSIYAAVIPEVFELRLGMNAVSDRTRTWVNQELIPKGNVRTYDYTDNRFKYPVMYDMLYQAPSIGTNWMIWFDDDSWISDPSWLPKLDTFIGLHSEAQMIGKKYFQHLKPGQCDLAKTAPWYKGKQFELRKGAAISTFATGGYWAAKYDLLARTNWPWVAQSGGPLQNNGGDVMTGTMCWQQNVPVLECYDGVRISDAVRRGASQKHPGA